MRKTTAEAARETGAGGGADAGGARVAGWEDVVCVWVSFVMYRGRSTIDHTRLAGGQR